MAAAANGRGCAVAAMIVSLLAAAVAVSFVLYGGYKALDLEDRVAKSDAAVAEYKQFASHLSAQLQTLQRVDTTLGSRLQAAEAALASSRVGVSAAAAPGPPKGGMGRKGGMGGMGGAGGGDEAAAPKAAGESDGGGEKSSDPPKDPEDEDPDDEPAKGKGKGKGKGRRKKNKHKG